MSELPRLAIFQDESSAPIFEIFEAAIDLCRIIWVVGWSSDEPSIRVLSRFGDVADLTGMNETQAVAHLVALQPDGVVVYNDPPIRLAAQVALHLGLPFHTPSTALLLTDKLAQRTALHQAGLPGPAFAAVPPEVFDAEVPFPAVLKPRQGAGARDTFMVENPGQLADALSKCNPDEKFLLEEWLADRTSQPNITSDVVSVESVVRNGVLEHVMVSGRFPYAPPFRDTGGFLPSDLGPIDTNAVTELAGTAARALEVRHGILHTEIKMTPSGPRIIEVNGRLGGGVSKLISRIGGPSLTVWAMQLALGLDIGTIPVFSDSPVAFFRFIVAPQLATKVETVGGVQELNGLPGIDEIHLNRQPGDAVDSQRSSFSAYVLRIEGMVESHAELSDLNEKITSTLQITWNFS